MKLLCILVFFISSLEFCGQSENSKSNKAYQQKPPLVDSEYLRQTLLFLDQVKQENLNNPAFILVNKSFAFEYYDCLAPLLADTIKLTTSERTFVNEQSKRRLIEFWNSALLPKITIINNDSVQNIFNDRNKGWKYFYEHIGKSFSSFSAPIFVRNYSYCVFYSDNSCGNLCGEGQLALYKKQNGKWKQLEVYVTG